LAGAGTTRKLATIVALDVAGYSARTEADEARTTAEVAALRKVIEGIAARHGGRIFNTAGDGFMLEFGSSLAAFTSATSSCSRTVTSWATASTSRPA
jgi:adenylate cyclase